MTRSTGVMASSRYCLLLLAALSVVICNAGPLPNITSIDLGFKEGSCALGDVVYMSGDEFPGASPCEKCSCSHGDVQCAKQRCEPRPGCKAVHRPDHCCPTYQCECEQEGRIYGNGEKLVDPLDPCRVCYCQGGEVVCRRIACFVRDDCRPRLVPGRCCPEYDNCPVRGVTALPGMTPSIPNPSPMDVIDSSAIPVQPSEPVKPEITIKEITPVSEIPVITDVKIKEILPSSNIEVAEYSSSKSPLIPREATSEKSPSRAESNIDLFDTKEKLSSSITPELSISLNDRTTDTKSTNNQSPSKISLSPRQDSASTMFEPKIPSFIPMMGGPVFEIHPEPLTTKAPILEEEDLDHNPAFPPIPDDLFLVLGNHEEEIIPDQNLESEHTPMNHNIMSVPNIPISTEGPIFKETSSSTVTSVAEGIIVTKDNTLDTSSQPNFYKGVEIAEQPTAVSKENSMLNMRSVIPKEILNAPSLISDDATGDMLDVTESSLTVDTASDDSYPTEISDTDPIAPKYLNTDIQLSSEESISETNPSDTTLIDPIPKTSSDTTYIDESDQVTHALSKSTEILSRTEFSSIPIETSDQNPRETSDKDNRDKFTASTLNSVSDLSSTSNLPDSGEINRVVAAEKFDESFENGETTEFILTSFGSQESATDMVELIKISSDSDKNSAIIEPARGRDGNVLTDLINLVGDVASISDQTTAPIFDSQTSSPTTISDSEELIPVNFAFGYKSKNKNWNLNSITEMPLKNKVAATGMKQKVVEIEDDADTITDSPPPYDKVEPTTRPPPIIDNVSDEASENKTAWTNRSDIEIITQSYVPTINRRPTKVVMEKSNDNPGPDESVSDAIIASSAEQPGNSGGATGEASTDPNASTTDPKAADKTMEPSTESSSISL